VLKSLDKNVFYPVVSLLAAIKILYEIWQFNPDGGTDKNIRSVFSDQFSLQIMYLATMIVDATAFHTYLFRIYRLSLKYMTIVN
jgi:hypothetical protein